MNPTVADAIFWVAVLACVIAQLAILRSVLGVRTSAPAADARVAPARRSAEIAWALIPALALAGVLVLTWRTLHPSAGAAGTGAAAALTDYFPGARA